MSPKRDEPLVPCQRCRQHHQSTDTTCPHCGVAIPPTMGVLISDAEFEDFASTRMMYGPSMFIEEDKAIVSLPDNENSWSETQSNNKGSKSTLANITTLVVVLLVLIVAIAFFWT